MALNKVNTAPENKQVYNDSIFLGRRYAISLNSGFYYRVALRAVDAKAVASKDIP